MNLVPLYRTKKWFLLKHCFLALSYDCKTMYFPFLQKAFYVVPRNMSHCWPSKTKLRKIRRNVSLIVYSSARKLVPNKTKIHIFLTCTWTTSLHENNECAEKENAAISYRKINLCVNFKHTNTHTHTHTHTHLMDSWTHLHTNKNADTL